MPFEKVGRDTYRSPSGRKFTGAQVRLYYAHGGKFPQRAGRRSLRRASRSRRAS